MKFLGARPQHEDLKLLVEDSDAVAGNLAEFDADGNPVDSGISSSNLTQGGSGGLPLSKTARLKLLIQTASRGAGKKSGQRL